MGHKFGMVGAMYPHGPTEQIIMYLECLTNIHGSRMPHMPCLES